MSVSVLGALLVLSAASREQLLRIMGAPDVVGPKRLPGLLPQGTFVAHKRGTNPQRVVNDVGPVRERVLAEVGRAVYDQALRARPK